MDQADNDFELSDEGKSFVMINSDMRLTMSPRNWQLQKKTVAKTTTKNQKEGEILWTSFMYFTSFDTALKHTVHINTAREFFKDAQGLAKANAKVIKHLTALFSPEYVITSTKPEGEPNETSK